VTGWGEALDAFEQRLHDQRAALATGAVTVEPFRPPDGLGTLPRDLEARASALLADALELEAELEARLDAARPRNAPPARPARPVFLDTRA
jgi:hypothetical protein